MAAAWIVLNILDLWLTSKALEAGAVEGNPVLAWFLSYSFLAFVVAKMSVALGVVGIYQAYKTHKRIIYALAGGNLVIGAVVFYEIANLI